MKHTAETRETASLETEGSLIPSDYPEDFQSIVNAVNSIFKTEPLEDKKKWVSFAKWQNGAGLEEIAEKLKLSTSKVKLHARELLGEEDTEAKWIELKRKLETQDKKSWSCENSKKSIKCRKRG